MSSLNYTRPQWLRRKFRNIMPTGVLMKKLQLSSENFEIEEILLKIFERFIKNDCRNYDEGLALAEVSLTRGPFLSLGSYTYYQHNL